jgi:iron complex outermembrane receptor protein
MDILPKYIGRQYLDNTQQVQRSINAYAVTDVMLNVPLQLTKNSTVRCRAGIYNVFNRLYESNGYTFSYIYNQQLTTQNYYYPQAGRRWMFGLGIDL